MFGIGEYIIYGSTGVCQIKDIQSRKMSRTEPERMYYMLSPAYSSETIFVPVDTGMFMRPVMSRQEAEELIDRIPEIDCKIDNDRNLRVLKEHYQASLDTHSCTELVGLIKSVYMKMEAQIKSGKKPGQIDQRYMKRAEDVLHGELAIALDIPVSEVPGYIRQRCGWTGGGPDGEEAI